uniref:Uncharacterized protein n=1 Tax=Helianthus annuus TaxID=4232 RepID=A0A251SP13_HELAN
MVLGKGRGGVRGCLQRGTTCTNNWHQTLSLYFPFTWLFRHIFHPYHSKTLIFL